MTAIELRIGNSVLAKNNGNYKEIEVISIGKDFDGEYFIEDDDDERYYFGDYRIPNDDIKAILLTEEWLDGTELNKVKSEFTRFIEYRYGENDNATLRYDTYDMTFALYYEHKRISAIMFYVHEAQNITFALTGEELKQRVE